MITILYDNQAELENLKDFFHHVNNCYDFSDALDGDCSGSCKACCENFIETCIHSRYDYNGRDFLPVAYERSCNTCANNPICWLSTTAAAPAPCRHYIPEGGATE